MSFFCLLWIPFFLALRRSLSGKEGGSVIALFLGSITAVFLFFLGDLVIPGGFGLSRWIYGFVNIVCLPVLLPLVLYTIFKLIFGRLDSADFEGFTLFWMIPVSALFALNWSARRDPLLLVTVPLLWTALAAGIPYFISLIFNSNNIFARIGCVLGILALPVSASFTYWYFFSQQTLLGFLFFFVTQVPLVLSFIFRD